MMKLKNLVVMLLTGMITVWVACKEEPPYINYNPSAVSRDTTYVEGTATDTVQSRMTVLEDFSGVKCKNCPDAQKIAHDLDAANPNKFFTVTLHPKIPALSVLVDPINDPPHVSRQDFRTAAAATVCQQIVGVPSALPRGAVNRMLFAGKTDILIDRTDWADKLSNQFATTTPLNIWVNNVPGAAPNEVEVTVRVKYLDAQTDSNYLSIMLLENDVIDAQEYETVENGTTVVKVDDNYRHMHVLRDMFTNYTGDLLNKDANSGLVKGRVFEKTYKLTLKDARIVKQNLVVLAFVHKNSADRSIIHAAEAIVQ